MKFGSRGCSARMRNLPEFKYFTDISLHNVRLSPSRSSIIQHILNTAKQMRTLRILLDSLIIDENCFQVLLRSQLKNLSVLFEGVTDIDFDYSSLENHLLPNHHLKYLNLQVGDSNIVLLFTKYFLGLERLKVAEFDERIFGTIFNYQTKFHNLILRNWYSPTIRTRENISPVSLQHWNSNQYNPDRKIDYLRHLFTFVDGSVELTEFLLNEYVFPNLESLNITTSSAPLYDNSPHFLFWLSIHSSNLEFLRIRWQIDVPFSRWYSMCANLPKLRYLLIWSTDSLILFDDSEYRQLFEICPSLRIISHVHHDDTLLNILKIY